MIKKTIIISVILFSSYSIFVAFFAPKWWSVSQHQWQTNIINAQEYIYNDRKDTIINIIVGSSLSTRLVMNKLPHTYNLSFGGQSILDGLNILCNFKDNKLPKNIYIETNFILRGEDKNFTQSLNTILYYPKKQLLSLREDKKPIAILGFVLDYKFNSFFLRIKYHFGKLFYNLSKIHIDKLFSHLSTIQENNLVSHPSNVQVDDLFSKLLALQVKSYNEMPTESHVKESFDNLKMYLKVLEDKKVNIVFFEMPVNSQLSYLPKTKLIRETFYKYFPPARYMYIPYPDSLKFITTDGIHLNGDEGLEYTNYLKNRINN